MSTRIKSKAPNRAASNGDLRLVDCASAEEFLERFQNSDFACAAINHNLLQIATALKSANELFTPPYYFWTLEEQDLVIGAAIYADPDGLVVSNIPSEITDELAGDLLTRVQAPNRVIADPIIAEKLVARITQATGSRMDPSLGWYVGKLDVVAQPKALAPGHLRRAKVSDRDFVVSWGAEYEKEKSAFLDVAKFMSSKLTSGELYVWEDDVPTTIVTVSGRNDFSARVSSVYTPPRHRGLGYASSAVAAVCDKLLKSGCRYIVLTWRIGDPAGRLYQRLGFRVIGSQQSFVRRK